MAGRRRAVVRTESAVSAGGVVYRGDDGNVDVVICGRLADNVWGLPKGTPDGGETLEATAVREVMEETGLEVEIVGKIGVVEYWFSRRGTRYHKWVHHYLFEPTGGDTEAHDLEYDRVEWRPIDDALRALTFENEAKIVQKARPLIESRLK